MHRYSTATFLAAALVAGATHLAGGQATEFAPGIVSTGHEFTVTFAPAGDEVFFTRSDPATRRARVVRSILVHGEWQSAKTVELGSTDASDLDPALSVDGKRLYFVSTRPRPARHGGKPNDMDIWYADRAANGWSEPHWIEALSSDAKEGSPSEDRHGNLCFFSDRNAAANNNAIYCAKKHGDGWGTPIRVEGDVNAGPSNTSPWLSADGMTMLFYSTRPGGAGQADLYIAHKQGESWTSVASLGPAVNTPDFEYNPSVSRDGRTLYFGRKGRVYAIPLAALDPKMIAPEMFK
jgi:Tol biopolymer transport system component